jgi:mannose-6-phosphate isomerase-like protein (cupin superfamily)
MKPIQPVVLNSGEGSLHYVLGSPYRFLATGAETGGAFALLEVTAPPQHAVPLQVHTREDETFFILEGTMEAQCAGSALTLERNATAFLPRNIPHSYRNPDNVPARYLVMITPGGFEKCLEEFARLPANQPPSPETLVAIGKKYGLEFPAQ